MKNKGLLAAVLICLAFVLVIGGGCTTMSTVTAVNRRSLLKLTIGISKEEAFEIMDTEDFLVNSPGYWAGIVGFRKIPINNPYRSEIFQGKGGTLEVIYYVTDVKRDDWAITDDELTPLVFDDGKLIGWGQSFLEQM